MDRAIVFIDGQNLYCAAKDAFAYTYPNYDVKLLSQYVCSLRGWSLSDTHFYTGIPDKEDNAFWHAFWALKLSYMGRSGVKIFNRPLRYHNKSWKCPDCLKVYTFLVGHEKGVDVRIALDVIRLAHEQAYDVAVIFSQDQDLTEVVDEVKRISTEQKRLIKVVSVFPLSPTSKNKRGISKVEWIKIDRKIYDSCIDHNNYYPQGISPLP